MRTIHDRPVAVVGFGPSASVPALRRVLDSPVEALDPYDLAMGRAGEKDYRAVVVENFRPRRSPMGLNECATVRWTLPDCPLAVVSLDDPAGRRLALQLGARAFPYSDGKTDAALTAKNVNLRWGRLEFEALSDGDLVRVRLERAQGLYGPLAALACALALGMPLRDAAARICDI